MAKKPKKLTAIRFKEEHLDALNKIAQREDESISEIVRRAVIEFLHKDEAMRRAIDPGKS